MHHVEWDDNLCWFCKKRPSSESNDIVNIYKGAELGKVKIPRCVRCKPIPMIIVTCALLLWWIFASYAIRRVGNDLLIVFLFISYPISLAIWVYCKDKVAGYYKQTLTYPSIEYRARNGWLIQRTVTQNFIEVTNKTGWLIFWILAFASILWSIVTFTNPNTDPATRVRIAFYVPFILLLLWYKFIKKIDVPKP